MKKYIWLILILIVAFVPTVYAADESVLPADEPFFTDTLNEITSGKLSLMPSDILKYIRDTLFYEIRSSRSLVMSIFIIALISGVLNTASADSGSKRAAFFACFCLMTIATIKIIDISVGYGSDVTSKMSTFITKLAPALSILLITSGYSASSAAFYPMFSFGVYFVSIIVEKFIIPMIYAGFLIGTVNNLSNKAYLNNFSKLLKTGVKVILTGSLTIFTGINAIYGFCTPSIDSVGVRTAKFAAGSFIPIAGNFLSESIETVIAGARVMKNAAGAAGIIVLVVMCAVPLIKTAAVILILRVSAVLIEPLSDKRYSMMLCEASDAVTSVFASIISVSVLFIISISIVIMSTNI